jgi:hypothetical protein
MGSEEAQLVRRVKRCPLFPVVADHGHDAALCRSRNEPELSSSGKYTTLEEIQQRHREDLLELREHHTHSSWKINPN